MEIKTVVQPCWKCGQITRIVETDNRFTTDKDEGEEIREKYPFYFLDFSKESEQGYYMNHCEHCGTRQGDNFLFVERLLLNHERSRPKPRVWENDESTREKKVIDRNKLRRTSLDEFF